MDQRRVSIIKNQPIKKAPVVYWMQRDQRVADNWALLYAQEQALQLRQPLSVVFCLVPAFEGATFRHYHFMLQGLAILEKELKKLDIPFHLLQGDPQEVLPAFLQKSAAGLLVTDFNPLRIVKEWKQKVAQTIDIPFHEVDAHNIIPARFVSDKLEYAAFTLRKKMEIALPEFLVPFPKLQGHPEFPEHKENAPLPWKEIERSVSADKSVQPVSWIEPGETEALRNLTRFIDNRLDRYDSERNFPDRPGQSNLSPYLHFGQLSAQRVALKVRQSGKNPSSCQAFLEELIVRRELSDNFCLYNPDYDRFSGLQPWARTTLDHHRDDPREYLYTYEKLEQAATHDDLWNAAQQEMVKEGKMHGYMRMYWAKKILEWTAAPEEAMAIAIYLNDKYELDGRDPNGYAGIAWAIGGTHDRPWGERKIFGMIRYMNYNGCKRKFDIKKYIRNIENLNHGGVQELLF